jgi:hypothetical protein
MIRTENNGYLLGVTPVDTDSELVVTFSGVCGAHVIGRLGVGLWDTLELNNEMVGQCESAVPFPPSDPANGVNVFPTGVSEVFSSPYYPTDTNGRSNRTNEAAVRSVLVQFGISNPCSGACKVPGEACRPVAFLLNKFVDGGTVDRAPNTPKSPWAQAEGMKVWKLTPHGPGPHFLQGQLYCECIDPTK